MEPVVSKNSANVAGPTESIAVNFISAKSGLENRTRPHTTLQCPFHMFHLQNAREFRNIIKSDPLWDNLNLDYFAIILEESTKLDMAASEIFNGAFSRQAPNLVVFSPLLEAKGRQFLGYSQNPITKVVAVFDMFKEDQPLLGKGLFSKVPQNQQGTKYKAATFILPPFTYRNPGQKQLTGLEVGIF